MKIQEKYIKRCIEIAKNGLGSTAPNPMVGSVIVYKDVIIGEGYTSSYGGNHAEVNAIESVIDKSLLSKATLYVTLEPCSHFGKTPPCSDLIIRYKIPNIVIGTIDTHSKVAGKGIEKLKASGCNVTVGILENECKMHHKRFFTYHNNKRPYIILKWAETSNGFISPNQRDTNQPVWITNTTSRQLVHKWRSEEQAILVGTNTVLHDNPSLTTRGWSGNNPIRIVIDRENKLSKKHNIFDAAARTIVISEKNSNFKTDLAKQICDILFENEINSIIIEGGSKTLQTFINENLWDEARVFIGSNTFKKGINAPQLKGKLISEQNIDGDLLKTFNNIAG
ncbi:bifunctional diaminohydroxyphosphoribosylaminopyrimidine deaminase/5-amino-6-(5-phosphoribosylamino)uracil reductase RibD [Flavobacteriaceae bacterium AU392]|nr:bifunctional diaminohydroxyphosphoribosylaminopyrimidine deaminase/5-amino-6-(5-phosphoribosylamino)uracil reductase RibD [Flavobacteriaceae bacterium]RKM86116.1 bifunctional diaminohydroxyphosphoribosylaminopyrimidine deaminase/5-amino-6-(5-phosphoribosylamino)uracil reductase RibD [Flavobacteriaceae bacterium AU392]